MKKKIRITAFLWMAFAITSQAQDKVIRLYDGKAPGSENWNWNEAVNDSNMFHTRVVYNVSDPTLTVFAPASGTANGTAIVIAPGGGFRMLSINSEGYDEAKWLAAKGVTCFVLRYRLVHSTSGDPVKDFMDAMKDRKQNDSTMSTVIPLSIADGLAAVSWVRTHAAEYNVKPDRIGFMGFSAGGTVTMGVVYNGKGDSHPNFIAPVYAYVPTQMSAMSVPTEKTPAFILAATDDQLGLAPHSVGIYNKWLEAKQSAELHIYTKGGHGFGSRVQNIPTDHWIDRFVDWLEVQGLLKK